MRPTTVVIPETEQRLAAALATLRAVDRALDDDDDHAGSSLHARVRYTVAYLACDPVACECAECKAWRVLDADDA